VGWNTQVVIAQLVIIEGGSGGLFLYAGTPAAGDPPVFFVVPPGMTTDPFGNELCTLPHTTAVMGAGVPGTGQVVINDLGNLLLSGSDGQDVIRLNPNAQRVLFYNDPPAAGALLASAAAAATTDTFGNTVPQGLAGLRLSVIDGAAPAAIPGMEIVYGSNGRTRELSPSGLDTALSGARANVTPIVVNQAVLTALTQQYPIPAGDAMTGSVYTVTGAGTAMWASIVVQQLMMAADLDGGAVAQASVDSSAFAAGTALQWEASWRLQVITTGAGGSASVTQRLTLSPGGNHTPGDSVTFARHVASAAFDTTVSHTFGGGAFWASSTGAPSITCTGSQFERIAQ
jgi:hypothetical protein